MYCDNCKKELDEYTSETACELCENVVCDDCIVFLGEIDICKACQERNS